MKKNIIIFLTFFLSLQSLAVERYDVHVVLPEKRDNGKAWDSFNVGSYRKPEISISINGSEHLFRCRNSFSCEGVLLSEESQFSLRIFEFDSLNKNELVGEGVCFEGKECKIGVATIHIQKIENPHNFGNCEPQVAKLLSEKQVMKNINDIGSSKGYYFTIQNCHLVHGNNHMEIDIDMAFIGKYQSYLNKSSGKLITSIDGLSSEYTERHVNSAFQHLKFAVSVKDFFIEKDANIIVSPRK